MLSDPAAPLSVDTNSGAVVFDKDGVLEQICSSKGYIDMSTVDPREIGQNMTAETAQLVIRAAGKEM
ncbi:hypothetical protein V6N11_012086 [Hibiscus sabdariffa]|uniref:Uncharacterized protein n=1 Tax=Hibiscus sabdariffa TaxID=183260 RepID=A0ABR2QA60_9ROSI